VLYWKIITKARPPNYEFSLQFVRAMACKKIKIMLEVAFVTHIHKFCSQIQVVKKINIEKKQALLTTSLFLATNTHPPRPWTSLLIF